MEIKGLLSFQKKNHTLFKDLPEATPMFLGLYVLPIYLLSHKFFYICYVFFPKEGIYLHIIMI